MDSLFPILIIIGIVVVIILLTRKKPEQKQDDSGLKLLLEQMNELSRVMDSKMSESRLEMRTTVQTQFSESQKLLREINEQMRNSLIDVTKEQTKTNEATSR